MNLRLDAPWHKASWDHMLAERLPRLLQQRLPLLDYQSDGAGRVTITLATPGGDLTVAYAGIPMPNAHGIFEVDGTRRVVVPVAAHGDLASASIACAGEQFYDYCAHHLGEAPPDLPWDETLVRVWLPLDEWARSFLLHGHAALYGGWTTQTLDDTNWLAIANHIRRLVIGNRDANDPAPIYGPQHAGRVCPFEMPEGPNIGRIFVIARGAEIRDERLVIVDDSPQAQLGFSAAVIPLLEHDEPARLLMGSNMQRQWLRPPDPEPALVQTGVEPDAPDFWCGRNLLTAYIAWEGDTYEDGIVLSASCARRLSYDTPAEPGDKLSTRHGAKGVVSRILPDEEMPHLPDGTPVEIVFNFISLHARLYFGQVREAVLGRLARAEGRPAIAPPFAGPDAAALHDRLVAAGLPPDGMETLRIGRDGPPLAGRSTVGWVYWGRLVHTARSKLQTAVTEGGQPQGEMEYAALRDAGALEHLREHFNTRVATRPDAATLVARVTAGTVEQAGPPTPAFAEAVRRLALAGIAVECGADGLRFAWRTPEAALRLAQGLPHPWLYEHALTEIGIDDALPAASALREANRRLQQMLSSGAPPSLRDAATRQLTAATGTYVDALLTADHLRFAARVLWSGRAVLAPGPQLRLDQVGVADEIAWALFGPVAAGEVGAASVTARDAAASDALDRIMAQSWVVLHRAPSLTPTAFIAFHPVRLRDERVLRLHPLACRLLQTDFDGDQAAVFLPLTTAAQAEAATRLSIAGHLQRDPTLLGQLVPNNDALWGLAWLGFTPAGRREVVEMFRGNLEVSGEVLTAASLLAALERRLKRDGIAWVLEVLDDLMQRGFAAVTQAGASLSPFPGTEPPLSIPEDGSERPGATAQFLEMLAVSSDWCGDLGPQLLALRSGAWGATSALGRLLGAWEPIRDLAGHTIRIRHGYRDGLSPEELFAVAVDQRETLGRIAREWGQSTPGLDRAPTSLDVLARALRSEHPGIVFARAAAIGEVDPLSDPDSRRFVGIM